MAGERGGYRAGGYAPKVDQQLAERKLELKQRFQREVGDNISHLADLGARNLSFEPTSLKGIAEVKVGLAGLSEDELAQAKAIAEKQGKAFTGLTMEQANSGFVNLYPDAKSPRKFEFSLFPDGTLSGKFPRELEGKTTREEILSELLDRIHGLNSKKLVALETDILPAGEGMAGKKRGEAEGSKKEPPEVDPRRNEFWLKQDAAIVHAVSRARGGLMGYRIVVFPTFVAIDHPVAENALFILKDLDNHPPKSYGKEDLFAYFDTQPWMKKLEKATKKDLGAEHQRITHLGDWEKRVQPVIDALLAESKRE